jgi:protein dithiol oxidoreductase (disulfide-forming)
MHPRQLLVLAAFALIASCGGNGDPAVTGDEASDAPVAVEDIAAGAEVPESEDAPAAPPAPAATSVAANDEGASPTSARFQLGTHYNRLSPTQPTSSSPDKVEVAEIFWYGCPHCFAFDPYVKSWESKKPDYASFVRVPAVWNPLVRMHAQAFYTAEALGKGAEMHDAFFREIHDNQNLLDTQAKLQAFFGKFGVDAAAFKSTWESFAVHTKLQRADELSRRYKISSVPMIVVNGKYTSDGGMAGSYDNLFALVDELVQSERAGQ